MQTLQVDRSCDLKRLQNEGYEIEVKGGHLIVHHVPYVNANCHIKYGKLITPLKLNNDVTVNPVADHVIYFMGEHPCNKDGSIITAIQHSSPNNTLFEGIVLNFMFSNKPQGGYKDYYHKVTRYIEIITSQAKSIDRTVTAQTYKVIECLNDESIFTYTDSNSSRANINRLNEKFKGLRIGIIGLGGTGSYILDFVAKTPVDEILLFDSDEFLQHNAFRSPGAASVENLGLQMKKVDYYLSIYSKMRRGIKAYPEKITEANVDYLKGLSYVFICIDNNSARNMIISKLRQFGVTFIDVGLGVNVADDNLVGTLRITVGTSQKYDHIPNRIGETQADDDEYGTNIQIADLNALNALMAVFKWKKLCGFYQDLKEEHNSTFTINTGQLIHEDHTI
jgi:hypothetical protein